MLIPGLPFLNKIWMNLHYVAFRATCSCAVIADLFALLAPKCWQQAHLLIMGSSLGISKCRRKSARHVADDMVAEEGAYCFHNAAARVECYKSAYSSHYQHPTASRSYREDNSATVATRLLPPHIYISSRPASATPHTDKSSCVYLELAQTQSLLPSRNSALYWYSHHALRDVLICFSFTESKNKIHQVSHLHVRQLSDSAMTALRLTEGRPVTPPTPTVNDFGFSRVSNSQQSK